MPTLTRLALIAIALFGVIVACSKRKTGSEEFLDMQLAELEKALAAHDLPGVFISCPVTTKLESPVAEADERTHLVALARRLEEIAEDDPPELPGLLAEFNRALATDANRHTFQYLYQSQEPEELVDSLLARRMMI